MAYKFNKSKNLIIILLIAAAIISIAGCNPFNYSSNSLYPENIKSVYIEMFDNKSFRRDIEYTLTDAIAKRIEADTPYKIVTDRNIADTVISGHILSASQGSLVAERETGRSLQNELKLTAVFTWKNIKTGTIIIENQSAYASADYSQWQNQGFSYASNLAANKLAQSIVELMELKWQ